MKDAKRTTKTGNVRHGAMLRAKYFPPQSPRMCREYCPICKRICELPENHNWEEDSFTGKGFSHICAMEHNW